MDRYSNPIKVKTNASLLNSMVINEKNKFVSQLFFLVRCTGPIRTRHDIAEILLTLALNTNQSINQSINPIRAYYLLCIFSHIKKYHKNSRT